MGNVNNLSETPVDTIKGVGPAISRKFAAKGIETVEDLFYFLPIRYEDKRKIKNLSDAVPGENSVFVGRVVSSKSLYFRSRTKKGYEVIADDGTGTISLKWFQWAPSYIQGISRKGNLLMFSGRVTTFNGKAQIVHPGITVVDDEEEIRSLQGIVPFYSEIEKVKQGSVRNIVRNALDCYGRSVESIIPGKVATASGIPSLADAIQYLHFPGEGIDSASVKKYRDRLILEEYVLFQLALLVKREERREERGIPFRIEIDRYRDIKTSLPFDLTVAQDRVLNDIERDMAGEKPMNRLIQGDVGSGKTVCALLAACIAVCNGYQAVFMAPTEILAEQHYFTVSRFLENKDIPVVLLRGGMGGKRRDVIKKIASGQIPIIVGTHALIQEGVVLHRPGLVIIDEQHRFGVIQRRLLKEKASPGVPHVLVMTATPIPRTLSMVIYGDLDVSIIDQLPPGRQKVATRVFRDSEIKDVYSIMERELKKGRQVFVVYPLVEESEKMDLLDATKMADHLQKEEFPRYRVGLVHGKMKAEEKAKVMRAFEEKATDILVSTTVIEVGIDIPNASLIVIEHAERFGLSQLHQLRGRVGRGGHPSNCALVARSGNDGPSLKRLNVMEKTGDGFVIAEEDLKIRGPGDMLGIRQSGIPDFKVGDIVKDGHLMSKARALAQKSLEELPPVERERIQAVVSTRWGKYLHLHDTA